MNESRIKDKFNVDQKDVVRGYTPLMRAIACHSKESVDALCKCCKVDIVEVKDQDDKDNAISLAVKVGDAPIFARLILTMIKRKKISNISFAQMNGLLTEKQMNQWLDICAKNVYSGFYGFLVKLNENGIKTNNFNFIVTLLSEVCDNTYSNQSMQDSYYSLKCDNTIANHLFEHLNKSSLNDIFKVIENGMLDYKVCFNDSLLLLCKLVDENRFNSLMKQITKECLSSETKNIQKYLFFKNNLLTSNVWATSTRMNNSSNTYSSNMTKENTDNNSINTTDGTNTGATTYTTTGGINDNDKDNKQEDEKNRHGDDETTDSSSKLLFSTVENDVIIKELAKQREFIKDELINLEENCNNDFKMIRDGTYEVNLGEKGMIRQDKLMFKHQHNVDLMSKYGIQADYKLHSLPFGVDNGFEAKQEYDFSQHLTKLLIASHNIDMIFQRDCKAMFDEIQNKEGLQFSFCSAPVKTRQRCQMKARIDYQNKPWPHVRCVMIIICF